MKFHLPLALLAAMIPTVYAETHRLTEDTPINATEVIMSTTSDSLSYTSADATDKKDLTITGGTTVIFQLRQDKNLSFDGLDVFSLSHNNASTSGTGPIDGNNSGLGTISMSDNNKVILDNNKSVTSSNYGYGSVVKAKNVDLNINNNSRGVDITNNSFTSTSTKASGSLLGGAIYMEGSNTFNMCNNGAVNISGNSLTTPTPSSSGWSANGGAVASIATANQNIEAIKWDANHSITVANNKAEGASAYGGAMFIKSEATISNTVGKVEFSGNKAIATRFGNYARGGAISLESGSYKLNLLNNSVVEFRNNKAQGNGASYNDPAARGGALAGGNGASVVISGSKEVNFIGNISSNVAGKAAGGAIYSYSKFAVDISGNDSVNFCGNGVEAKDSSYAYGGAIYTDAGAVEIRDNKSVIFEKNYEKGGDFYLLRSIYSKGYESSKAPADLNLSAANGGHITIKDSILVSGNLNLNEAYNGKEQKGSIVFSGISTENDLNDIIAANTAEGETARTATEAEIELSRTSVIEGSITLNAGTLSLQDGAVLQATKVTIAAGATLEIKNTSRQENEVVFLFGDASTDTLLETTLDANLYMQKNSVLKLDNATVNLNGKNLVMEDNISIVLNNVEATDNAITLFSNVGSIVDTEGNALESVSIKVNGTSVSLGVDERGSVVFTVPEPTTATLSLLALAGLAMRRRRK